MRMNFPANHLGRGILGGAALGLGLRLLVGHDRDGVDRRVETNAALGRRRGSSDGSTQ